MHEHVRGGGGECEKGGVGCVGDQDNDDYEKIKMNSKIA